MDRFESRFDSRRKTLVKAISERVTTISTLTPAWPAYIGAGTHGYNFSGSIVQIALNINVILLSLERYNKGCNMQ